ncbi:PDDEXK nuclease domain-containing protein [Methanosarcina sp.]|jgi:predicted nuclease of restriction endonuclease-like (RecB) superfamily|uniref:PDDEXK nuclease domain-containing protein n=1 Tax=Methanosarcina sp. TaxID=2213 RepID=UPI002C541D0A|nr:PDDEXK nuclease domain-containing protein [Methanosarcina sp.]HOW15195.1 PDDEXK nuclease domain-containing protein [Methanosarcina sp.]
MSNKAGKDGKPDERMNLGLRREEALFPAAPPLSDLPEDYAEALNEIKSRIQQERLRVVLAANSAMTLLYWDIGQMILKKQSQAGWGAKIIDRLAKDLREAFPDMKGFSSRNLKYMRAFAETWQDPSIVQQLAAQIPWFHNCLLLDKIKDQATREWYIHRTIENGWSRNILSLQIESKLHERQGKAITNFKKILPPEDSDMAIQVFKDPYLFDFLGTADLRRERELEQALVDHIQNFLLELGAGFAFVGRQVPLEVAGHDFLIDLLFYHLKLRCFVVIELKAVPFDPSFIGQLNFYLSAVDDLLRHPDDKPAIGLLLCRTRDKLVVEYALRDLSKPIGVAEWETRIVKELPKELESSLPSIEELEKELNEYDKGGKEQ